MTLSPIQNKFFDRFGSRVRFNEPLQRYCTFSIGGPAEYLLVAETVADMRDAVQLCNALDLAVHVFGCGSNLLIPDAGVSGLVLIPGFDAITIYDNQVQVQAGARLNHVISAARDHGLGGIEFLWGIPGTIAGAAVMNAGACGKEIGDKIVSVTGLDAQGTLITVGQSELSFSYRSSDIKERGLMITELTLELEPQQKAAIEQQLQQVKQVRKAHYPSYPSAGCVFKNPPDKSAGALIDACGFKGKSCGGAQVWDKHANFIINREHATSADVRELMQQIQQAVHKRFGITLEPEIMDLTQMEH